MIFLHLIVLGILFSMILNGCEVDGVSKYECLRTDSVKYTSTQNWRCCWYDAKYKYSPNENWRTEEFCADTPYNIDWISSEINKQIAFAEFQGGEADHFSIDCSAKWIHSFFGLILLISLTL